MKIAITILAMGLCTTSVALHASSIGTIYFSGLIVHETCADAVAVNHSPEPQRVPNRCASGATGAGGNANATAYTEHMTTASGDSGIDVLDYYVDLVRESRNEQTRVLTRNYH